MTKKLLFGIIVWCLALAGAGPSPLLAGPADTENIPSSGQSSRFTSDLYVVDKRLLGKNDGGDTFDYQLTFQARREMRNVLLVESLPEGVTLIQARPQPDRVEGRELFWRAAALPAGAERSIVLTVRTEETGTFITRSWVSADTGVALPLVSDSPGRLELTKTSAGYAEPGEVIPFLITVKNAGTRVARNVQVIEVPPPTLSMGNFNPLIGDLQPGESREISLTGRTVVKGSHVNLARAFQEGVPVPVEAQATVIVADPPKIDFTKRGDRVVPVSRPATTQILLRNAGGMPMRDLVITDSFPAGVELRAVSGQPRVTPPKGRQPGALVWNLEVLEPGQVQVFEYTLMSPTPVTFNATARVEGNAATGKRYSEESSAGIQWKGIPGVLTTLADTEDPLPVGGTTTYKLSVVNQSQNEPIKVNLTLRLSPGLRALHVEGGGESSLADQVVIFPELALEPREYREIEVVVQGQATGPNKATLEMRADFLVEPVLKEESTFVW